MRKTLSTLAIAAVTLGTFAGPSPASAGDFDAVPHLVRDLVPGGASSGLDEDNTAVLGNRMVFAAERDGLGKELWITDGTTAGTKFVKDINPAGSSNPSGLIAFKNKVYFAATDPTNGSELWSTDGTTGGTKLVKDIAPGNAGSTPRGFAVSGSTLYMEATTTFTGRELWKTDGTTTSLVKDINDTGVGAESGIAEITALPNGGVIFRADAGSAGGMEPWVSNGTQAGTTQLNNINPAAGADSDPISFTRAGSNIFFTASDSPAGRELWVTDGGSLSTHRVADIAPGPTSSDPYEIVAYGNKAAFKATTPALGEEPWISDGTTAGTIPLEIRPGSASSDPGEFTVLNASLFFKAIGAGTGSEIWTTLGTPATTRIVKDICPGSCDAEPGSLRRVGTTIVFNAYDSAHGVELWSTNGTSAGTGRRGDGVAGPGSSFPTPIGVVSNTLFFESEDSAHGAELWAYTVRASTTTGYKKTVSRKTDRKRAIYVTVQVRATGTTPIGKVVLKRGTKVIGTANLAGGSAKIRITQRLGKGKHSVRAYYYGSVRARTSHSPTFTVKVR